MTNFTTYQYQFAKFTSGRIRRVVSLGWATACCAMMAGPIGSLSAQSIVVPNFSFESPTTPTGFPAFPQVDLWQKTPEVPGIPLPGGITWDQLSGVFPNTAPGTGNHIDNMEGTQAAYLFAIPGVGLHQTLGATFDVGNSYSLSVGILGGGGITEGSTFELSFYYMDEANSLAPVASTSITYTPAVFPNATHLLDYQVTLPTVQAADAWAGKAIGVRLLSTFGTGAGYWDVDNVRLTMVPEPGSLALMALGVGVLWGVNRRSRTRS